MLTLRPYQREAIEAVYQHLRDHDDNPVVVIPTAGGKTPILATICKDAVTQWNGRVLILAHVKELLEQAADKLRAVCPEVKFGVYSAGLKRRDTDHAVIVAGIQSVYRRACELDAFDLVIVDEAHLIPTSGDGMYRQFLAEAKVINPSVRVIGLTATPFRLDSGAICGPEHFLNTICYEVGVRELIRDGYLCPLVTKAGKTKVDTSGLHMRAGEFVADEVESLVDQDSVVEAACREIIEATQDRQAVLIFAAGVAHGRHVARVLREKHGVECGFVCGETPTEERDEQEALVRALLLRAAVIVHLEDDTVPSPDALRYFDWAVREMLIPDVKSKDGHQITLASGYNKPKTQPRPDQSHLCDTRPIWTPWGWAMDRSRLSWLLANWCTGNPKCFTCKIKAQYRRTRRELFPVLSRIQNIGYDLGENGRTAEWYRANHRAPWVAGRMPGGGFSCAAPIAG